MLHQKQETELVNMMDYWWHKEYWLRREFILNVEVY